MNAIDGARRQALVAARTELRNDDDIDAVVEDGAEGLWAGSKAGIAVDADAHVDHHRWVFPHRIALARFDSEGPACLWFVVGRIGHGRQGTAQIALPRS